MVPICTSYEQYKETIQRNDTKGEPLNFDTS